jgi:hypothetical protein
VDLERRRVEISETVVEVAGILYVGPPKTRAGRRMVPLPRIAIEALRDHLATHPGEPSDLVFAAPLGGPVRLASWRSRFWLPAVKRSKVGHLRLHDLRHTAVALWIAAGASPKEASARAGHTSVSFTLDRYGHLYPGSEDIVNDRLDAMVAEGRSTTPPLALVPDIQDADDEIDRAQVAPKPKPGQQHRATIVPLIRAKSEWALEDSNLRPQPCEGCALTS